jgi:hypothetical protein
MPRMIRSRNPDESLARRAFGAISDMRQSSCHEDVERVARALFGDIGLPHFALARFFSADKAPDVKVLAGLSQTGPPATFRGSMQVPLL